MVAFPKKIKTIEDVLLYISSESKARQVFKDIIAQDTKNIKINPDNREFVEDFVTELSYGYIDSICYEVQYKQSLAKQLEYDIFEDDFIKRHKITKKELNDNYFYRDLMYRENSIYSMVIANEIALRFCEENKNYFLYKFSYGDDNGDFFSEMEHGNTFLKVPHIKINKH